MIPSGRELDGAGAVPRRRAAPQDFCGWSALSGVGCSTGFLTSGVVAGACCGFASGVPEEAAVPPGVFSVMDGAFRARQGIAAGPDMGRPRPPASFILWHVLVPGIIQKKK